MRRPKGIKTKKSVAKRFKITGRGKVLRSRAGKRHLPEPERGGAGAQRVALRSGADEREGRIGMPCLNRRECPQRGRDVIERLEVPR